MHGSCMELREAATLRGDSDAQESEEAEVDSSFADVGGLSSLGSTLLQCSNLLACVASMVRARYARRRIHGHPRPPNQFQISSTTIDSIEFTCFEDFATWHDPVILTETFDKDGSCMVQLPDRRLICHPWKRSAQRGLSANVAGSLFANACLLACLHWIA